MAKPELAVACGTQSKGSPGVGAIRVRIFGDAKLVCLKLPDGAGRRVIVIVDGVVEIHNALPIIPV